MAFPFIFFTVIISLAYAYSGGQRSQVIIFSRGLLKPNKREPFSIAGFPFTRNVPPFWLSVRIPVVIVSSSMGCLFRSKRTAPTLYNLGASGVQSSGFAISKD